MHQSVQSLSKLAPTLNVLWSLDSSDAAAVRTIIDLIYDALHCALKSWPNLYDPVQLRLRILTTVDGPPFPQDLATSLAIDVTAFPGLMAECIVHCDLIVADAPNARVLSTMAPVVTLDVDGPQITTTRAMSLTSGIHLPPRTEAVDARMLARLSLGPPARVAERKKLLEFIAEPREVRIHRIEYDLLLRLIGAAPSRTDETDVDEWTDALALAGQHRPDCLPVLECLHTAYRRTDALAVHYGDMWRSTSVARTALLFLTSVVSGLVGVISPETAPYTIGIQIAASGAIFLDRWLARRRRWRERWIDYRLMAERIRVARFTILAGAVGMQAATRTWMDWWLLRGQRAGAPVGGPAPESAASIIEHLLSTEINRQIAYQRRAFRRFRRLDRKIRRAGYFAFGATILFGVVVGSVAYLRGGASDVPWRSILGLVLIAAPGLLGLLNGVRTAFDVVRQAERAGRIATSLAALSRAVDKMPPTPELARAIALRAATVMSDDVTGWRVTTGS